MILARNFVDNNYQETNSPVIEVLGPRTGEQIGSCPDSSTKDVELAVESAHRQFNLWSSRTTKDRVQILIRFHALVVKNKDKLADLICLEHGKTTNEALAEIAKGNETVEYACSLPQLSPGRLLQVSRGVYCNDLRKPHGIVVSIVPFNFPFMVPMWTLPIAIALGNTLILKPSEKVPLTMSYCMELLKEAGLPDGVVNLVHGTAKVVEQLCDHELVKAVTFVGTTRVAEMLSKRCRNLNKRVLCLGRFD